MAVLAAYSAFDPVLVTRLGPAVALIVFLTGSPLSFRITPTVLFSLALVGWSALSVLWNNGDGYNYTVLTWLALVTVFIASLDLIRSRRQLRALAIGYLFGVFIAVARIFLESRGSAAVGVERLTLGDLNQNYLGYSFAAAFAVILLLWRTIPKPTLRANVSLIAVSFAVVVGIEFTGTRGAYVGLGAGILWLLFCLAFKPKSPALSTIIVLSAAFLIVTGIADQASLIFEVGERSTGDWSGRLDLWPVARELWLASPIVGMGAGAFPSISGFDIHTHNVFLEVGVDTGLIGVVLLLGLFWSALYLGSTLFNARERALFIGMYLATSAPAYLTGVWELAPAGWIILAMFSRLDVLANPLEQRPGPEPAALAPDMLVDEQAPGGASNR